MAQTNLQRVEPYFLFSVLPKGKYDFVFLGYTDDQHPKPYNGFYRYWPAMPGQDFDKAMVLTTRAVNEQSIECWETVARPYIVGTPE